MKDAPIGERAAYVADLSEQLAALIPDLPAIAVILRFVALDAALISIRTDVKAETPDSA